MKEKLKAAGYFLVRHCMVIFPLLVIAAVATTVAIALGADNQKDSEIDRILAIDGIAVLQQSSVPEETEAAKSEETAEESLVKSEDEALYSFFSTYYNALAKGDVETIRGISNFVKDTEVVRIKELSKYTESYPFIEIYTKPGPVENSWVAYVYTLVTFYGYEEQVPGFKGFYVCTDENGGLYLNDGETDEEVLEYIKRVSLQEDVIDLNNRVNAEYNDLMTSDEKLFEFISELEKEVSIAAGEALASQVADSAQEEGNPDGNDGTVQNTVQELTGTASTTVNVRVSDSELADKLGKLEGGQQVKVIESRQNGWTKVVFEGREGYVKSEYLLVSGSGAETVPAEENQAGALSVPQEGQEQGQGGSQEQQDTPKESPQQNQEQNSIGTKTASVNLNLRKEASPSSEKLLTVVGGDSVEVLSESDGWSQVRYKDQVGYVMSEYLY